MSQTAPTQDELKTLVAQAALTYVAPSQYLGVGTGSTVNKFIEALAASKIAIKGAVSSSKASTDKMQSLGNPVVDLSMVERMAVYIDGADEIDAKGCMIKGGGAALTREKLWLRKQTVLCASRMHPKRFRCWGIFHCRLKSFPCQRRN